MVLKVIYFFAKNENWSKKVVKQKPKFLTRTAVRVGGMDNAEMNKDQIKL